MGSASASDWLAKGHIVWACAFSRVKWLLSKHNCWCFEFKCSVLHHTNKENAAVKEQFLKARLTFNPSASVTIPPYKALPILKIH